MQLTRAAPDVAPAEPPPAASILNGAAAPDGPLSMDAAALPGACLSALLDGDDAAAAGLAARLRTLDPKALRAMPPAAAQAFALNLSDWPRLFASRWTAVRRREPVVRDGDASKKRPGPRPAFEPSSELRSRYHCIVATAQRSRRFAIWGGDARETAAWRRAVPALALSDALRRAAFDVAGVAVTPHGLEHGWVRKRSTRVQAARESRSAAQTQTRLKFMGIECVTLDPARVGEPINNNPEAVRDQVARIPPQRTPNIFGRVDDVGKCICSP